MPNAIRIHAQGGYEVLKYEPIDSPGPGEDEIAIRHGATGLNYIDVYHRSGAYPIANFPAIIGLEGAGTVFAVGKGVSAMKEGDRVAYAAPPLGAYADERISLAAPIAVRSDAANTDPQLASTVSPPLERHYPIFAIAESRSAQADRTVAVFNKALEDTLTIPACR